MKLPREPAKNVQFLAHLWNMYLAHVSGKNSLLVYIFFVT